MTQACVATSGAGIGVVPALRDGLHKSGTFKVINALR